MGPGGCQGGTAQTEWIGSVLAPECADTSEPHFTLETGKPNLVS